MNCKFCNAELPEEMTCCPVCGKENLEEAVVDEAAEEIVEAAEEGMTTEETAEEAVTSEETAEEAVSSEETEEAVAEEAPKQKPKLWLVILAIIGAVALLGVLVGAVLYGVGAFDKTESYTVSDEKAVSARETVVATLGDEKLTNSALQVYYWQAANDLYNSYGYYLDASVLDFSKPFDEQIYDEELNMTWQQFFLEGALTTWSRYAALCMQGGEEGYTLPADAQAYLDEIPAQLDEMAISYGYEDADQMLTTDMSIACDRNGYMEYLRTNFYAGQYLDSKYDSLIPTMAEIEAYYAENEATLSEEGIADDGSVSVDVRHILFCPQGGTEDAEGNITYSDAEWEACRVKAQDLLDQWKAGETTEESFAQLAMEYTEDPGSMSTGGLYTDVVVGQMVEPFENWCFDESRKTGDNGLVQTSYGYHIMYFVDSEEIWIANVRDNIIYERSLAIVDEAAAKWTPNVKYNKIAMGAISTETAE